MDQLILSDKDQFPTEKIILSHIGKSSDVWKAFFDSLHANHPDFKEEWRYYNDGKSWLLKETRKSKTVFWLGVYDGGFRVTFYFTDKANEPIRNSGISDELKKQFKTGKRYNRIRGLTVVMKNARALKDALEILELKLSLK